jgi:small subunit ribosomal protein S4
MARYRGPKQKIARRFSEPIFGPSKALERKNYGPGQHGRNRRKKNSEYAIQLMEKQKAKATYGLLEKQFHLTFEEAARRKGATGEVLIQLLESRLDNVAYRMGFARTRRGARQLVNHGHVLVNGRGVNIPSFQVQAGDVIELRAKSKSHPFAVEALDMSNPRRYSWLDVDTSEKRGVFLHAPEREDVPEKITERLIVELYSR